ncbi:MAG: hypothetical protein WC916_07825 [Candidatus Woesearchaeota archaeon]
MRKTTVLFLIGFIALALITTACSKIGTTAKTTTTTGQADSLSGDAVANLTVDAPPNIATLDDVPTSTDVPQ